MRHDLYAAALETELASAKQRGDASNVAEIEAEIRRVRGDQPRGPRRGESERAVAEPPERR